MSSLLTTKNLSVEIAGKHICQQLDLNVHPGECWAMLGMNGVGKTTLLHTLAGLRPPLAGDILLANKNLQHIPNKEIARVMGLLLQDYEDAFPGTVMQAVLCGRHPHMSNWQWESSEDIKIAEQALAFVKMAAFADRSILTLSGGERRRVAIAALLCQQTRLLLLDEPTNHLDLRFQHQILAELTKQITQNRQAAIMIMHDVNLATRYCDHALLLFENGEHLAGRCDEIITTETLSRLYDYPMRRLQDEVGGIYIPA